MPEFENQENQTAEANDPINTADSGNSNNTAQSKRAVIFKPEEFRLRYPEFTPDLITDEQLQQAFDLACLLLANPADSGAIPYQSQLLPSDPASPVIPYDPDNGVHMRETLLYLLVCHLSTLALWGATGQSGPASSMSASTNGLSLSFAKLGYGGKDWFLQTTCGSTYWQLMRAYSSGGKYFASASYHPWG